jgi:TPR repeat protein
MRKAAEQGDTDSQSNLGFIYYNGRGVPWDYVLAHLWFNLAEAQGDAEAKTNRDIVAQAHDQRADSRGAAAGAGMEA